MYKYTQYKDIWLHTYTVPPDIFIHLQVMWINWTLIPFSDNMLNTHTDIWKLNFQLLFTVAPITFPGVCPLAKCLCWNTEQYWVKSCAGNPQMCIYWFIKSQEKVLSPPLSLFTPASKDHLDLLFAGFSPVFVHGFSKRNFVPVRQSFRMSL